MNNGRDPDRPLGRMLRNLRSAFTKRAIGDHAPSTKATGAAVTAGRATVDAQQLINEGLRQRQRLGAAAARPYFERAAELEPRSHVPWFMLGNVASELDELDLAVVHYARARDLHPTDHVIRYNLGLNHLWRGYIDAAIEELRVACDLDPGYLLAHTSYFMALHSSDRIMPDDLVAATLAWGTRFGQEHRVSVTVGAPLGAEPAERLRVGFVSGDFRAHSVAHFFEPILSARDRGAFIYTLYSNHHARDAVTERLRESADEWRETSRLDDDAMLRLIRADRIDILVDLSGHTASNRLAVFARRGAPVQITYLGYPSSTGLATMDYRITDGVTDPPVPADEWHCEQLLRMPETQWCFRPFGTVSVSVPGPLPAREAGFITFGSFNNLTKASDTLLSCWVRILLELPTARLRLTRVRSAQRAADILALFERAGVAPERIECMQWVIDPPYGRQFSGVDIGLDSFPYNGVTTTCESLYFGVPVVSLHGLNGVSRSGLSLLRALGLGELTASTPERYVEVALALARDLSRLERLRASMRTRFERSPLRDEKKFAADFEALLQVAWRHHRVKPEAR